MLESEGVTFLEKRIVRSGGLQVRYLRIIGDCLRELARIEIAVADPVQRVGISRFGCHRRVDIRGERIARFVVLLLREICVALQVSGDGVVL